MQNYFETKLTEYDFDNWWVTDDNLTPQKKEHLSWESKNYCNDLTRIIYTKSIEINVVEAPKPKNLSEWVAYDNKDLLNLVDKAIDEYFYDMPINISSVQFTNNGGKMNSLGGTIWSGKKSKIVNNCDNEQINEPCKLPTS